MAPHGAGGSRRETRDHILPQAWGGRALIHGDVRNIRPLCRDCNHLRGRAHHCSGAVACALAVAGGNARFAHRILNLWGIVTPQMPCRKSNPIGYSTNRGLRGNTVIGLSADGRGIMRFGAPLASAEPPTGAS